MGSGEPRNQVDVVRLGDDGKEELVASAFLAGTCVLMTGVDGAVETICREVCERCGLDLRDGEVFFDGMREAYPPSGPIAYGAWCAVTPRH